jgi:predicted MFS family arabinose efflux permease
MFRYYPAGHDRSVLISDRQRLRRARAASTLVFFLTGAVFATWAARIPSIQERMDLSPGGLSVALVGIEAGAIAGLAIGAKVVTARDSRAAVRLGFAVYPPALVAAAAASNLAALATALAVMGAANSTIDVAINVQGIELERRQARPLLSGIHSAHSFGVLGGGLGGTLAAAHDVAPLTHFAVVSAIAVVASQTAAGWLVSERSRPVRERPEPPDRAQRPRPRGPTDRRVPLPDRALAMLGLLAFGAFFVEGAANDWSAVHLRSVHNASPGVAAAAFTAFSLTLAVGRTVGDRLAARHGRATLTRAAALTAAAGAVLLVAAPSPPMALAGWSILGAGMAPIAPMLLGAAPHASAAPPPTAVATVSTIGYAGSFAGPPIIGAAAELTSLRTALTLLAAGSLAIALLARAGLPLRPAEGPPLHRQPGSTTIRPANDRPVRASKDQQISLFSSAAASDSTRSP